MWSRLRLKTRLMLLFTLLLVAGMAANVALALNGAGARVAAEDESSTQLALDFIQAAAPALDASPEPEPALQALLRSLRHMRHITVTFRSAGGAVESRPEDASDDDVPAWFVGLIGPRETSTGVDVVSAGRKVGTVVIAAAPLDEIGEIWDTITGQLATSAVLAVALLAITFFTVGRALAPLADLSRAIRLIGDGRYDIRVAPSGPPELAAMCRQMNALAAVLGSTVAEKQRLAERIVTLQDDERRDLARELHDEFGPYLFAIRAHLAGLRRAAAETPSQPLTDTARALGEQVDALQATNRRVLRNLRPVALEELGLEAALAALINSLQESRPELEVDFAPDTDLDLPDDTLRLTIYRVVQESLTNVLRHADATRAGVAIDRSGRFLRIRVTDNGVGLPDPQRDGFGLRGMKERLAVLGGRLDLHSSADTGTVVEALLPAGDRSSDVA